MFAVDKIISDFRQKFTSERHDPFKGRNIIVFEIRNSKVVPVHGTEQYKRVYQIVMRAFDKAIEKYGKNLKGRFVYQTGDSQKIIDSDVPILTFARVSGSNNSIAIPDNTFFEHDIVENYGFNNILNWDEIKIRTNEYDPPVINDIYFRGREMGRLHYNVRRAIKKYNPNLNINYDSLTNYEAPWECKKHSILLNLPGASEWSNRLKHLLITGRTVINVQTYIRTSFKSYTHFTFVDYFLKPNVDYIQYELFAEMPRSKIPRFDDGDTKGYLCLNKNVCIPKYNADDDEFAKYLEEKNKTIAYVNEFNDRENKRLAEFLKNVQPNEQMGATGKKAIEAITLDVCYYFLYKAIELCCELTPPNLMDS